MKKKMLVLIITIITLIITSSCSPNPSNQRYEDTQISMDTSITITAYGKNSEAAVKDAFKKINEIDKLASLQISDSELNKINNASGKEFVQVSQDLYNIIKKSVEYGKLSNGAFDVTVGVITKLWNIESANPQVPPDNEIKNKLSLVGYENIKLNDANNSVMLAKPGMIMDLGGIAKGYAADRVIDIFKNYGIEEAIVNLGGSSIYVMGKKEGNKPWSIGIRHPRKERNEGYLAILREYDKAVSTSGDYERFFIKDNKRYHHIIDSKTGYPADSGVIGDTIVIDRFKVPDSNTLADALTTIVFVLGPEKGMQLAESIPGVEVIVTTSDFKILSSPGLKDKLDSISSDFKYENR